MKTLLLSTLLFFGPFSSNAQVDTCDVAGFDGTINVCPDSAFNLFSGLSGYWDSTGIWFEPTFNPGPYYYPNGLPIEGQYHFQYHNQHPGCPDADTSFVIVIVDSSNCPFLEIQEFEIEGISVFPNPTQKIVTINSEGLHSNVHYQLFAVDGSLIESDYIPDGSDQIISLGNLQNGVYLLHVSKDGLRSTFRIVKE